jgi:hypothetical protein
LARSPILYASAYSVLYTSAYSSVFFKFSRFFFRVLGPVPALLAYLEALVLAVTPGRGGVNFSGWPVVEIPSIPRAFL